MITSTQNTVIKEIKKLHQKKFREQTEQFLVEGHHLVKEAHMSQFDIDTIIIREDTDLPGWTKDYEIIDVTTEVFKMISQTETPQGIAAIVNKHRFDNQNLGHILLLDAIQDPGNLGTMIRTAEAAGFTKVVLGKGTVDPFNDKVIRATQGAMFSIEIIHADLLDEIEKLKTDNYSIWAATLDNATVYSDVEVTSNTALIIGNEGSGISTDIINVVTDKVKIPIYGRAESLNAGVAAGVLMYHLSTSFAR